VRDFKPLSTMCLLAEIAAASARLQAIIDHVSSGGNCSGKFADQEWVDILLSRGGFSAGAPGLRKTVRRHHFSVNLASATPK
jgi:hypothetical protein